MRSGTENVPGIVGFAKALELAQKEKLQENKRLTSLRNHFIQTVLAKIPHTHLNNHLSQCLPGIINISFAGVEAEAVVRYLSQQKIYVSSGSACSSQKIESSHVLRALGLSEKAAMASVRFSLGRTTSKKDLDQVILILAEIIRSLRRVA